MAPNPDIETWRNRAEALGTVQNPLRVPYQVGLKEAALAARFLQNHWNPSDGLPGLVRVASKLPQETSGEIVSLIHAIGAAHTAMLLIVDPIVADLGGRAREVLNALESTIELELDDDIHEPADDKLQALKDFDADAGESSVALGQSLSNFAGLAEELRDRLVKADTAFDPALVTEARDLSKKLLEKQAQPAPESTEAANARLLREQLLTLLMQRVGKVRSAARHVFRDHPDIVREVTSAYSRWRRAEHRAARQENAAGTAGTT
jgi:hypothetical protein